MKPTLTEFLHPAVPTIATEPAGACAVCAGPPGRRWTSGYDFEIRTCRNEWTFLRCDRCGHVQLDPRPAASALGTIYPPTYYAYNYEGQVGAFAASAKRWLDRGKFRGITGRLRRRPESYVDVGCGDGRFLDLMASAGVSPERIWGLELDPAVVDQLQRRGYRAVASRVEDCRAIPDGAVDLATMFHVIEHVADPAAVLAKIRRWLAPAGVLALETPNLDSLDARLFRDVWWGGYHFPRHWHLFTPATIARLLEQTGFEVVDIRYQTGHSFWLYSLHHRFRYGARPHPWLARQCNPLGGSLLLLAAVTLFDKVRAAVGARTSAMLVIARAR